MKAYQVRAPKSKPNLRIRRPKERKLSAEENRERESPGYLAKIRMLPCCIPSCTEPAPSHAHHLKCTGERGIGKKSRNKWTVPLCYECHINGVERFGSRQEAAWFRERGILCLDLAAALYANCHSLEAMLSVLKTHRQKSGELSSHDTAAGSYELSLGRLD